MVVPSGDSGSGGGLTGLLTSAAVAVAQQLGGSYFTGAGAEEAAPSRPRVPPGKWQMRCAVVNNLIFHIDVMAGWTHAFQVRGRRGRDASPCNCQA